jgi:hypothetical protein
MTWTSEPVVVSGKKMFDLLSPELKSLAVRAKVRYACVASPFLHVVSAAVPPADGRIYTRPHPYVWMAPAKALSTGLGIECDGLELSKDKLPEFEESKIKTFPMVRLLPPPPSASSAEDWRFVTLCGTRQTWVNPVTNELHYQVHPCGAEAIVSSPAVRDVIYPIANRSFALLDHRTPPQVV